MTVKATPLCLVSLVVLLSGSADADAPVGIPAKVRVEKLASEETPIYQHLWRLANAVESEAGQPVIIVLESLQEYYANAFVEDPSDALKEVVPKRATFTMVLNPRYPLFLFGESSLGDRRLTGEVELAAVLDVLTETAGGGFVWRYDAKNGVVNVIEELLLSSAEWSLNQTVAGTPFSAGGPLEALNTLAHLFGGSELKRHAPACQALRAKTDRFEVHGKTLREAVNSALSVASDIYRYYHVFPDPPLTNDQNLADWRARKDPRWVVRWRPEGYSDLLEEERRRAASRMRYIIPETVRGE